MRGTDIEYWVGFSRIPGIGKARLTALKTYFGGLENAWKAQLSELLNAGLDEKIADGFVSGRAKISLESEMEQIERYNIKVVTCESEEYPRLLKEISDYPTVIYIRGLAETLNATSVAVVGTRRATAYGRQVAEELVVNLALNNVAIVSGLAKGIDTIAHRAALEARGTTISVFASGLDIVYPPENAKLARDIMERGALVSEYPLGTKPKAENFPRRNRILSGLSRGVLVVESGDNSGALITANFALEQNREVFAVPGSINSPMSRGTNRLIQEGAKLVRNYQDVLEELDLSLVAQQISVRPLTPLNGIESIIIKFIGEEPVHIDDICRNTGLNASDVISNLAVMELNGLVKHTGGMSYVLARRLV